VNLAVAKRAQADALIGYAVAHPEAKVTVDASALTKCTTYRTAEQPKPVYRTASLPKASSNDRTLPKTGDASNSAVPVALAAAGVAAIAASRRRRNAEDGTRA
jgi:LPXTG-motif cell wall-anchored protein